MVKTVHYWAAPQRQQVTTYGSAPNDGWSPLLNVATPSWFDTTEDVAMWVTGFMGDPIYTTTPPNAVIEVGLGDSNASNGSTVYADATQRVRMVSPLVSPGKFRAVQFSFLKFFQASGVGAWPKTRSLRVYGRTDLRGDPASAAPAFLVSDIHVLFLRLSKFGVNPLGIDATLSGNNNIASEAFKSWDSANFTSLTASTTWLTFHTVNYSPRNGPLAPQWRLDLEHGGGPTVVSYLGNDRFGLRARGSSDGTGAQVSYWTGAATVMSVPATSITMRLNGRDKHSDTNNRTAGLRWRMLAIPIYDQNLETHARDGEEAGIVNNPLLTETSYPLEVNNGYVSEYLLGSSYIPETRNGVQTEAASGAVIQRSSGPYVGAHSMVAHTLGEDEGHPLNIYAFDATTPQQIQWKFRAYHSPYEVVPGINLDALEVSAFGFMPENDPDFVPYNAETPGPETQVDPEREAPALGSLTALPINPDQALAFSLEAVRAEMLTKIGYRLTWPRLSTPRRRWQFRWSNLTRTQRDTLITFAAGLTERAFKWTPPRASAAVPVVFTSLPRATDDGKTYTVSAEAIELVLLAP